jgi:hypothetical protein
MRKLSLPSLCWRPVPGTAVNTPNDGVITCANAAPVAQIALRWRFSEAAFSGQY